MNNETIEQRIEESQKKPLTQLAAEQLFNQWRSDRHYASDFLNIQPTTLMYLTKIAIEHDCFLKLFAYMNSIR